MGVDTVGRLIYVLCGCFFISVAFSCTAQKDFVLLNTKNLEIVNNTIESTCLNEFDNDVLITVLKKNKINYIIKSDKLYVERRVMDNRDFLDDINRDIQNELLDDSIPEGYIPFKYRRLNLATNKYETRPLDDLDKNLLPDIIKRGGFKHIMINDCLYVEREMIDNQDFLSKAVDMLDSKRKENPIQ